MYLYTCCNSPVKVQNICETTNFFMNYFLSRTGVYFCLLMRHDADLWIQWRADILAVVFLFHWCTLKLLLEAICLESFIKRSLYFGTVDVEVLVDEVLDETCHGGLSFTNHTHKLHNSLVCLFFDADLLTVSCSKVGFGHKLVYIGSANLSSPS